MATEVLRFSGSVAVYCLVGKSDVGQGLDCLFDFTGIWILVTSSSFCVPCSLYKAVETILWSILKKTVLFRSNRPQLEIEQQQRSKQSSVLDCEAWHQLFSRLVYYSFSLGIDFQNIPHINFACQSFLEDWKEVSIFFLNFSSKSMSHWA